MELPFYLSKDLECTNDGSGKVLFGEIFMIFHATFHQKGLTFSHPSPLSDSLEECCKVNFGSFDECAFHDLCGL
jgi:hypothetical protein